MVEDNKDIKHFYIGGVSEKTEALMSDALGEFQSLVSRDRQMFPDMLGEQHPFDPNITEGLYIKFGFINALIEKMVEYVWGGGIYVECENENAKAIIENFIQDTQFVNLGKKWTREALIKPSGFMELGGTVQQGIKGIRVLDGKFIFKKRDIKGKILAYNQLVRSFEKDRDFKAKPLQLNKDYIEFKPENIVQLSIGSVGDGAYGYGIIYPNLSVIESLLMSLKDMHMLLHKKANSPYWIKMGDLEKGIYPGAADVANMGQQLQWLHNRIEWVTGPDVNIEVVEFGDIGSKFIFPVEKDMELLFFGFQTPKSVMGAEVASGIGSNVASEHGSAFDRHIKAIQEDVEKVVEEMIFKRVLLANKIDAHVELIWGQPSEEEKRLRIEMLKNLLMTIGNIGLRGEIEREITTLLGYDEEILDEGEMEREEEEGRPQPIVPGSQSLYPIVREGFWKTINTVFKGKKKITNIREFKPYQIPEDIEKDYSLQEWIGFNYNQYIKSIGEQIEKDEFVLLRALNKEELAIGYLSERGINNLREAMKETFTKGMSIKMLASTLINKNIIPDLKNFDSTGKEYVVMPRTVRSIMVARTETIRLAAQGAVENYKENGILQVKYIAAHSDRTCDICLALDGRVFEIIAIPEFASVPIHPNCRCTYGAVVI